MRQTRARAVIIGFVITVGLLGIRPARTQPTSVSCVDQNVYISYRVLVFMRAALSDDKKLLQLQQQFPGQAVAELRAFLNDKVKDKPVDSATVLILRMGASPPAQYKLAGDMSPLADRLNWAAADVQTILTIAERFRLNTVRWDALVTSLANDTTGIDEGWREIASTKDNPYIAPGMAAALAKAYLASVDRRKAELRERLGQGDDVAKQVEIFRSNAPAALRYGEIKWEGVAPKLKKTDIEGFDRSFERATERQPQ